MHDRTVRRCRYWGLLALLLVAPQVTNGEPPPSSSARIEALCHRWTTSPCILRVGGEIRSEGSGEPLPGKRLRFLAGTTLICASVTDQRGYASCTGVVPSGEQIAETGYQIVFAGDDRFSPGSLRAR